MGFVQIVSAQVGAIWLLATKQTQQINKMFQTIPIGSVRLLLVGVDLI